MSAREKGVDVPKRSAARIVGHAVVPRALLQGPFFNFSRLTMLDAGVVSRLDHAPFIQSFAKGFQMPDNETQEGIPTEDPKQFPVWYEDPRAGDSNRSINGASCGPSSPSGWWDDFSLVDLFKVAFSCLWRPFALLLALTALLDYGPRLLRLIF
jgi:hypothetical protein